MCVKKLKRDELNDDLGREFKTLVILLYIRHYATYLYRVSKAMVRMPMNQQGFNGSCHTSVLKTPNNVGCLHPCRPFCYLWPEWMCAI